MLAGVISLAILLGAGVSAFFYPLLGILFLVACIPYDFPFEVGITVYVNQLVLAGVVAGVVLHTWKQKKLIATFSRFWISAIGIFGLSVLLSAINAEQFSSVFKQWVRWMEIIVATWLVFTVVKSRRDLNRVVWVMIGTAFIASIVGIVQTIAGPEAAFNVGKSLFTVDAGTTMRAYSTFGHPNQFAGYLVIVIPIAFMQFVETKNSGQRLSFGLLGVMMMTALVFTFSRGGWLALFLIGGILLYLNMTKRKRLIVSLALAVLVTGVLLYQGPLGKTNNAVMNRVASFAQPEKEDSVGFRGVCLKTGLAMIRKHPWIGFGAGEYERNIRDYFDEDYYAWEAMNKHIHSLYLQIAVEIGLLGLAAFLFLGASALFQMGRVLLTKSNHYERQMLLGACGAILAFLIHSFFDVLTMYARGVHLGMVVGLGLAIAAGMGKHKPEWEALLS